MQESFVSDYDNVLSSFLYWESPSKHQCRLNNHEKMYIISSVGGEKTTSHFRARPPELKRCSVSSSSRQFCSFNELKRPLFCSAKFYFTWKKSTLLSFSFFAPFWPTPYHKPGKILAERVWSLLSTVLPYRSDFLLRAVHSPVILPVRNLEMLI